MLNHPWLLAEMARQKHEAMVGTAQLFAVDAELHAVRQRRRLRPGHARTTVGWVLVDAGLWLVAGGAARADRARRAGKTGLRQHGTA